MIVRRLKLILRSVKAYFAPDKNVEKALGVTAKKERGGRPFLGKIDFYIIRKFLGTYFFSIALIMAIATIFDFNERIDKFTSSHAT